MVRFKTCNQIVVAAVFLLALFCCTPVYADDTSLGRTPEGVFPMQENDVIMQSEEITVNLEKKCVECIFVFHNTGKSKKVLMGFPGKLKNEEDGLTQAVNLELSNFKTFIKGKELPVTHEKSTKNIDGETSGKLKYSEYFTFTVPFKADEKVTVRNTYNFFPTYDSMGYTYSGYVLQTGAMWKDKIGRAKVTFKLGGIQPYEIEKLKPGGFKFAGNKLVWERNNFEPTYDLHIEYNTYRYREYLEYISDGDKQKLEIQQKIDSYNKIKGLASKGKTGELLALYNKAVDERNNILALYIRSYLDSGKLSEETTSLGDISIVKQYDSYYANCEVLGPEAALINISISHLENGNEIQDFNMDDTTSYDLEGLTPGIEYTITYTLSDWNDHTEQKTLKYKVPEKSEASTESQLQPSAAEISSQPSQTAQNIKQGGASIIESSNETTNENSDGTKLLFWILLGLIVVSLSVLSVIMLRKKRHQ